MTLEIRNKEGFAIADIKEPIAHYYFDKFLMTSSLKKTTKKINKEVFHVFEAIDNVKLTFELGIIIWVFKGAYIKIIS
jgi:hypothetical protein